MFEKKFPEIKDFKRKIGGIAIVACMAIAPIQAERISFNGSSLSSGTPISSRVPAERNDQKNPFKKPELEEERINPDLNNDNKSSHDTREMKNL